MTEREQKIMAFAHGELPADEMQAMQLTLTAEERATIEDIRSMDAMLGQTLKREAAPGLNEQEIAGLHQKIDALATQTRAKKSSLWSKIGFAVPALAAAAAVALYVMPATEQKQKVAQDSALSSSKMAPVAQEQGRGQQIAPAESMKDQAEKKKVTIARAKPKKTDRVAKRQLSERSSVMRGGNKSGGAEQELAKAVSPDPRKWERQSEGTNKPTDALAMRPAAPPSSAPAGGAGVSSGAFSEDMSADQASEPKRLDTSAVGGAHLADKKTKKAKGAAKSRGRSSRKADPVKFIAVTTVGMVVQRVERELDKKRDDFGGCPSGGVDLIMVHADVTAEGKPENVKIDDTPHVIAKCIKGIVEGMRFPPKKGPRRFTFGLTL